MASKSVLIRVPATVGNFAGAMNCAALALDASLNVKVTPRFDGHVGIRYFGDHGERIPRDRSNLAVRAMEAALHLKGLEFTGADFEIYSSVPVGVGLGSSTAAVLAGLLAADRLFRLQLDEKTLFDLAAIYEGRCDNLRAAWLGGFVACLGDGASLTHRRSVVPKNFVLSVVVPETVLAPDTKREQPADRLSQRCHSGYFDRAASLVDFFAQPGNGKSIDLEAPLPPTCEKKVPGLEEALKVRPGALETVFVCGTGPAVAVLAQDEAAGTVQAVGDCFTREGVRSSVARYLPTNAGAREWNAVPPDLTLPAASGLSASLQKSTPIEV